MTAAPRPVGWRHVVVMVWLGSTVALWLIWPSTPTPLSVTCQILFSVVFVWWLARVLLLWQEQRAEQAEQAADLRGSVPLGWVDDHQQLGGDTWAVMRPEDGETGWVLFPPGSTHFGDRIPYEGQCGFDVFVTPATSPTGKPLVLADVQGWLWPWVEGVTGRKVQGMHEGYTYYVAGRRGYHYTIYVRTGDPTFDSGPSGISTPRVVAELAESGLYATTCLTTALTTLTTTEADPVMTLRPVIESVRNQALELSRLLRVTSAWMTATYAETDRTGVVAALNEDLADAGQGAVDMVGDLASATLSLRELNPSAIDNKEITS